MASSGRRGRIGVWPWSSALLLAASPPHALSAGLGAGKPWSHSRQERPDQAPVLHTAFRCPHPAGDCSNSLYSLQHVPLSLRELRKHRPSCVRHQARDGLRVEVSLDIRCLPGLPLNVTCFSISQMYPKAEAWPHGYGTFEPLRGCTGTDPDFLHAVCTLRCAVTPSHGRHAELFCVYELDRYQRYGLHERYTQFDFCDASSACVSASQEEGQITCSADAQVSQSTQTAWMFFATFDRAVVVAGGIFVAALLGILYWRRRCRRPAAASSKWRRLDENALDDGERQRDSVCAGDVDAVGSGLHTIYGESAGVRNVNGAEVDTIGERSPVVGVSSASVAACKHVQMERSDWV
eukprot:gnl/TRDRNA2_/TRDRNA2_189942_c0_seq1.p1 gnl/TRDRNA2_/TRDRNA2_189942_c0~~gnl/TRDRNA2_/TRDRNA2_189942_c0_seq1.p1  ORF type:complete len:350 (+),score=33.97 gnl/TRDRNA2_/TRDRNA2_189942_c0_seq1:3-1052(+)